MRWTALLLPVLALTACGSSHVRPRTGAAAPASSELGPAFGLSENNADLLWSPDRPAPPAAAPFLAARRQLTALRPQYVRLTIDWATFQPSASSPVDLGLSLDGCARGTGPCGAFAGVAGELAAIGSQQRAERAAGGTGFQVVVDLFGVPAWAALPPHGCERLGTEATARPIAASALADYVELVSSLLALAAKEGVQLPWWSPWNEPNDPRFVSPQRQSCSADGPALAPLVYAQLARAMAAELKLEGGEHQILLGELGGYGSGSAHRLSVQQFVTALPPDVLCLGDTWAVHDYAGRDTHAGAANAVSLLEAALDARGGCASSAGIWVTEVGAGAPEPGEARIAGAGEERAGCLALAREVLGFYGDPRVKAVFQYTFRDDPDFPVGLADAELSHLFPVYGMWLAFTRAREHGALPPTPALACGP